MKKNILLYILIFLVLIIGIVAFKKTEQQDDKTTITFWTLQLSTFDKYINGIISEFEKENPEIKVKWIDVPYSEGEKRTLASVLTDNPPDLVNLTPDFSRLLAEKNALYMLNKSDLDDFVPSITETLMYEDSYFGIPFYATSAVTLCNLQLKKDFKIEKFPRTYDDIFNLKVSIKNNSYLTMINFSENDTLLKLLNKYNINTFENINSQKSVEIFERFKNIYDNNLVPKESVTQSHREALEKYMAGQLVFLVTGANFINMIKENAPQVYKNTVVLPQLVGDTGLYDYSLMNFAIPKRAHNKDAALKFALFFTNKENQIEFAKLTTILPTNKQALQNEYFRDNKFKFKNEKDYLNYLISSDKSLDEKARMISAFQLNYLQPQVKNVKNKKELNSISSKYVQEILINNKNIKEILDEFSADWEKL